jgi:hypothetical protein
MSHFHLQTILPEVPGIRKDRGRYCVPFVHLGFFNGGIL